ncbi:MAG TPA: cupin domain-containing protein, partial [Wenzhouxiangella sp.]|nr:cupin domain-containing protein [Wenzhouxiangella sp.]
QKVTSPEVELLAAGKEFQVKQMKAEAGDLLPKHSATVESVLIVMEGECILTLEGVDHALKQGDSFIVPPRIKHQISVVQDFKAVHVMSNDIRFDFFD